MRTILNLSEAVSNLAMNLSNSIVGTKDSFSFASAGNNLPVFFSSSSLVTSVLKVFSFVLLLVHSTPGVPQLQEATHNPEFAGNTTERLSPRSQFGSLPESDAITNLNSIF